MSNVDDVYVFTPDFNKFCKCGKKAKSGVYCVKCYTVYHNSCAIKYLENNCCGDDLIGYYPTSDSENLQSKSYSRQTSFNMHEFTSIISDVIKSETSALMNKIINLELEVKSLKECNEKLIKLLNENTDNTDNVPDGAFSLKKDSINSVQKTSYANIIKENKSNTKNGNNCDTIPSSSKVKINRDRDQHKEVTNTATNKSDLPNQIENEKDNFTEVVRKKNINISEMR